jgi:hypothetical protein
MANEKGKKGGGCAAPQTVLLRHITLMIFIYL